MKPLTLLAEQLSVIQKFLDKSDIPAQQILTFVHVAAVEMIPMADLAELTGVGQSSVSRNAEALGDGKPRKPGHGLIESYEDPEYRKRKLVKLTPRGKHLKRALEKVAE